MNLSVPWKLAFGVYVNEPLPSRPDVPLAGGLTTLAVSGLPSASVSLASTPGTATVSGVSSAVLYVSLAATGASLTLVTVMVTVATFEATVPSWAWYVNWTVPTKPAAGM